MPKPVRVLIVPSHVQPSTREMHDADVVIQGRVVTKHRNGVAEKILTERELERVKAGDHSPLGPGLV